MSITGQASTLLTLSPNNSPPIGIGILGTGFGKTVHIPALHAHPNYKIEAICGHSLTKTAAIAQAHQIPHYTDNWQATIDLPQVQVVSITTPPFLHFAQAQAALRAGKHLLLEKPIALTLDEAKEIARLAIAQNLLVAVDFEFRCVPPWRYLHDLIQQGTVGKPRLITVEWIVSGRANPQRQWNWYSQKEQGGGALGALASHSFDYIPWLFGEIGAISARLCTAIATRPDADSNLQPVSSDDTCHIYLELTDGTPINMMISTVAHHGSGHWISVYGDRATLKLGSNNLKDYVHGFQLYHGTPEQTALQTLPIPTAYQFLETHSDGRIAPVQAIYDRLYQSISTGTELIPSIKEGIASQELMHYAHLSNQTGKLLWLKNFNSESM